MKSNRINVFFSLKWINSAILSFVEYNIKMNKGDVIQINLPDNKKTAIIACPKCGSKNPLRTHELKIVKGKCHVNPSINNLQCCGYHGFLKNGIFTNL